MPPEPDDSAGREEAEHLKDRIVDILRRQSAPATVPKEPIVGPRLVSVEINAARGGVRRVDKAAEDVIHQLESEDGYKAEYVTREPFVEAVMKLGAKARAAGIHLVLATQRPDRQTVPGPIKANPPGKIGLRVQDGVNSRIVLGRKGAETLLGKGDLLADLGRDLVRAQAPLA